jgi:hypothetical protein
LGGAAVVVGLYATTTPLLTGVVAVAALTFSKEVLEGLEFFLDWKQGKTQNGLHYLLRLKRN